MEGMMTSSYSLRNKPLKVLAVAILLVFATAGLADLVKLQRGGILLREGAGNFFPVIAVLDLGSEVTTLGAPQMGWQKVKSAAGEGFISANVLAAAPQGRMTPVAEIAQRSELKTEVTNTAISAMIKGLVGGPEGDKLATAALYPQVNPKEVAGFRSEFELEDLPPPIPASAVGMSLLPEIMAASPAIANNIANEWGGRMEAVEPYLNQINLWLAEQAGANSMAPVVIASKRGMNAQALPGGWVVIGGEILALTRDESEVAGLLAHELAHAILHHGEIGLKKEGWRAGAEDAFAELDESTSDNDTDLSDLEDYAKQVLASARRRYSIGDELQADSLGTAILARSGYDPSGLKRLLDRVAEQGGVRIAGRGSISISWIQSRQELADRQQAMEKQLKKYKRQIKKGARKEERFAARMGWLIR